MNHRRIRVFVDYEGPFLLLDRIGWEVVDDTEVIDIGTAPAAHMLSKVAMNELDEALAVLVEHIDRLHPQQLSLL